MQSFQMVLNWGQGKAMREVLPGPLGKGAGMFLSLKAESIPEGWVVREGHLARHVLVSVLWPLSQHHTLEVCVGLRQHRGERREHSVPPREPGPGPQGSQLCTSGTNRPVGMHGALRLPRDLTGAARGLQDAQGCGALSFLSEYKLCVLWLRVHPSCGCACHSSALWLIRHVSNPENSGSPPP